MGFTVSESAKKLVCQKGGMFYIDDGQTVMSC